MKLNLSFLTTKYSLPQDICDEFFFNLDEYNVLYGTQLIHSRKRLHAFEDSRGQKLLLSDKEHLLETLTLNNQPVNSLKHSSDKALLPSGEDSDMILLVPENIVLNSQLNITRELGPTPEVISGFAVKHTELVLYGAKNIYVYHASGWSYNISLAPFVTDKALNMGDIKYVCCNKFTNVLQLLVTTKRSLIIILVNLETKEHFVLARHDNDHELEKAAFLSLSAIVVAHSKGFSVYSTDFKSVLYNYETEINGTSSNDCSGFSIVQCSMEIILKGPSQLVLFKQGKHAPDFYSFYSDAQQDVTVICPVQDRFIVKGFRNGFIYVYPLTSLFFPSEQSLLLNYHRTKVTSIVAPPYFVNSAASSNSDTNSLYQLNWIFSSSEDGVVVWWDIHSSIPLRVFHAHPFSLKSLHEPVHSEYKKVINEQDSTKKSVGTVSAKIMKETNSKDNLSVPDGTISKFSTWAPNFRYTKKHPLKQRRGSIDEHSVISSIVATLFRSLYVLTSNGSSLSILSWEQGRIGWFLSGLEQNDSIIKVVLFVPTAEDSEGVYVYLMGLKTFAGWLLRRNGGECVFEKKDLKEWQLRKPVDSIQATLVSIYEKQQTKDVFSCELNNAVMNAEIDLKKLKHNTYVCNSPLGSTTTDLLKGLLSALAPLELRKELDDSARSIGIKSIDCSVGLMLNDITYFKLVDDLKKRRLFMWSISKQQSASMLMALMILFKKLMRFDSLSEQVSLNWIAYISTDLFDDLSKVEQAVAPALSLFAHFYHDSEAEAQISARILTSSFIRRIQLSDLKVFIDRWMKTLPTINRDFASAQFHDQTIRSCILLSTLIPPVGSVKGPTVDLNEGTVQLEIKNGAGPIMIGPKLFRELLLSLALLLSTPDPGTDSASVLNTLKLLAAEILANNWDCFSPAFQGLTVLDLKIPHLSKPAPTLAIPSNTTTAALPLQVYVMRKLWSHAAISSSKETRDSSSEHIADKQKVQLHEKDIFEFMFDPERTVGKAENLVLEEWKKHWATFRKKSSFRSVSTYNSYPDEPEEKFAVERRQMVFACRQAVISICQTDPTTYVNLLSTELLNAGMKDSDWERTKILLRAGVLMVAKQRPISFFPHYLPGILEAIIKGCLDPNIPFTVRERISPVVTNIIHEFVRIYPTISFHALSQRLAIATASDNATAGKSNISSHNGHPGGQIIFWDLKTATRVQILDAHGTHSINAVSFNKPASSLNTETTSPKKNTKDYELLLVSYSIEERCVKVWHPYSNIFSALSSSFHAVTRHSSSSDNRSEGFLGTLAAGATGSLRLFRTFQVDGVHGEQNDFFGKRRLSYQSAISILQEVRFEWLGDRTVTLKRTEPLPSLTFNF